MAAAAGFTHREPSLAELYCDDLIRDASNDNHADAVADLASLYYQWDFWARPEQRQPSSAWVIWVILAGRGWGKTRTGAETIREEVERVRGTGEELRIALVGATIADVREVMLDGESGLLNIFPEDLRPRYIQSRARVVFPGTRAVAYLYSAEKPRKLRGPQHHIAWCDELAAWAHLDEAWSNLQFGLRLGDRPRVIVTTTPRPLPLLLEWEQAANDSDSIVLTRGTTYDNQANLPKRFFSDIIKAYEGTRLGEQELLGKLLGQLEGALFKREWIRSPHELPQRFSRVIVAIDPAISKRHDETGIVVVGRAGEHAYVLEDLSGHWSPQEWAARAAAAVKRWKVRAPAGATVIVAEVNRGGDLVKDTIRQADRVTPVKETRAYRGKGIRAEPVAALYEQGRVWHAARFEALELQMCTFDPLQVDKLRARNQAQSPDRLDAMVWGVKELGFHLGLARYDSRDDASLPSEYS